MTATTDTRLDPVTFAVLASRLDAIAREMTETLMRTSRSSIINTARDLSCSIVTGDDRMLAAAEGLPIQVLGGQLQARAMREQHPDLADGDAFLNNDPYGGNMHAADHAVVVPVFHDGEHVFTVCAVAHQADCGNAVPTAYNATARDVYEEGALIFPCVRVQRDRRNVDDVIRMARARIRVPDQWYGDYLAQVGSARIGERRLKQLIDKYSIETLRQFVEEWFDYSERCMVDAIGKMPAASIVGEGTHDQFPGAPDGVPLRVGIEIDPGEGTIEVDLRDNPDCMPFGLNLTEVTSYSSAVAGVLNSLGTSVPVNAGSFRRIKVLLRENCVVGIPRHPHSCSVATTNIADRIINIVQSSCAELGEGWGLAEGAMGMPPSVAVVSGADSRYGGRRYINQIQLGSMGGPASPETDGWVGYGVPVIAGLMYRDSVEVDELKYAFHVEEQRLLADTEGAGRMRGAPGSRVVYRPLEDAMTLVFPLEAHVHPPRGVRGGLAGAPARGMKRGRDGTLTELPGGPTELTLLPGEAVVSFSCGGGGYGSPLEREPAAVLADVEERWVTREHAERVYGVVLAQDADGGLRVDADATARLRATLAADANAEERS